VGSHRRCARRAVPNHAVPCSAAPRRAEGRRGVIERFGQGDHARPSPVAAIIKTMDPGNRGEEFQNDARDDPEERGEEHPQGTGGQSFKRTHPFAYWLTVGPIAIMVGIIVVAALAVFVVLVSMG